MKVLSELYLIVVNCSDSLAVVTRLFQDFFCLENASCFTKQATGASSVQATHQEC